MEDDDKCEGQAISCVDSGRNVYDPSLPGEILRYDTKEEDSEGELENDCSDDIERHEPHDELVCQSACGHLYRTVCM